MVKEETVEYLSSADFEGKEPRGLPKKKYRKRELEAQVFGGMELRRHQKITYKRRNMREKAVHLHAITNSIRCYFMEYVWAENSMSLN